MVSSNVSQHWGNSLVSHWCSASNMMLHFQIKCILLMLVYLSTTLFELLIMSLSVHKRSTNGKTPVSLSVLCKIRYQQPADNVYSVLQHVFITFFNVSHSIFRVPFHIPFHSAFQLLQFTDHTTSNRVHGKAGNWKQNGWRKRKAGTAEWVTWAITEHRANWAGLAY